MPAEQARKAALENLNTGGGGGGGGGAGEGEGGAKQREAVQAERLAKKHNAKANLFAINEKDQHGIERNEQLAQRYKASKICFVSAKNVPIIQAEDLYADELLQA